MKFQRKNHEDVSLNLTPLIDVVFLLLIFFMVTTTFTRESHLELNLPEAQGEVIENPAEPLEVLIDAQGGFSINGDPLVNAQPLTLRRALLDRSGGDTQQLLVITADGQTPHQAVVTAMDVAGQLGFTQLSITTQEPEGD